MLHGLADLLTILYTDSIDKVHYSVDIFYTRVLYVYVNKLKKLTRIAEKNVVHNMGRDACALHYLYIEI